MTEPDETPEARAGNRTVLSAVLAACGMLLAGVALRWPIVKYTGPHEQWAFNRYVFRYLGAYSDIASLYFRDSLARHPTPYVDYPFEYPVGMGVLVWLANFARGFVPYMVVSAVALVASGVAAVYIVARTRGANPWLVALSPSLAAYVLLNWDLFGIVPFVAAIYYFDRDRDRPGALCLAAAIWTKFFPILLVPLILVDRYVAGRKRDAVSIAAIVAGASVALNAPIAFVHRAGEGLRVRAGWAEFFRYSNTRNPELNFWNLFGAWRPSLALVNRGSGVLLVLGTCAAVALLYRVRGADADHRRFALRGALLALVAWFFFINKVYSPQYGVWVVVLLALVSAPPALAVAFGAIDIAYFLSSFVSLYLASTSDAADLWYFQQAHWPLMLAREGALLFICVWSARAALRYVSRGTLVSTHSALESGRRAAVSPSAS